MRVLYRILHIETGRAYIGQTVDFKRRMKDHCTANKRISLINRAIKKYGKEANLNIIKGEIMKKILLVLLIIFATIIPCLAEPTTMRTNQIRGDVYTKDEVNAAIALATSEISVNSTITVNANGTVTKNDVVSLLNTNGVITAKTADNTMVSGIATTTATDGNPVTILLKGTATGLSGLTAGANYYRQADYSIGTTPVSINGAYIFIGYGGSATTLILD